MDDERIRKAQINGMLSPTKLRMKLMVPGRNSSSKGGRNSLKDEDLGYEKNRLLSSELDGESSEEYGRGAMASERNANDLGIVHQSKTNASGAESVHRRVLCSINRSTMNPIRDSDEGGSFEFHNTDRTRQRSLGLFDRQAPSKWNDAEKWIINRQKTNVKEELASMSHSTNQTSSAQQMLVAGSMTVEHKPSIEQPLNVKFTHATLDTVENFSFVRVLKGKSVRDVDSVPSSCKSSSDLMRRVISEPIAVSTLQTVSMRNMGTEMTPVPTPLQSVTPNGSSISSLSSSPRPGAAGPLSTDLSTKSTGGGSENRGGKDKLSEAQMRLNIRREIAALGIKLGKMSIASWASKEVEQFCSSPKTLDIGTEKGEFQDCAAAWEEAENIKYLARYRSEHVKIQAWETHQKAKIEAKMKNAEFNHVTMTQSFDRSLSIQYLHVFSRTIQQAEAERVMACANKKMAEKLVTTQQQVEQKKAAAKARMNKQTEEISRRAERIRQTGRMPSINYLRCCGYF